MPAPRRSHTADSVEHRFLGASNLWLARRQLVQALGRYGPSRLSIAAGPGRSYGQTAGNPFLKYPSLLASDMFAPPIDGRPGLAVLTDVGNDIAYGIEAERLLDWVSRAAERLRERGFEVALTRLPLRTLERLPDLLFHLIALLFFGRLGAERREIFERLETVENGVQELALERGFTLLECDEEWFGWDGFHLRGGARSACWECWSERLLGASPAPTMNSRYEILRRDWRNGFWEVQLWAPGGQG